MAYKLDISENALEEIENTQKHITEKLRNPTAAKQFVSDLIKCLELLKTTPEIYEYCSDSRLNRKKYRRAIIHNYLLFYTIEEENKVVKIAHLYHNKKNYTSLL